MIQFWAIAMVVFLIIEAVTVGLASIWFAIGALAALISALFGAPLWLQIVWFIVISGITIYFTRPLAKKYVNTRRQPTNADRVIGMTGIVSEDIDNVLGTGTVHIDGKYWTARSSSGMPIKKDELVVADGIEGVRLFVTVKNTAGNTNE